jgi:hypothetical protein
MCLSGPPPVIPLLINPIVQNIPTRLALANLSYACDVMAKKK